MEDDENVIKEIFNSVIQEKTLMQSLKVFHDIK